MPTIEPIVICKLVLKETREFIVCCVNEYCKRFEVRCNENWCGACGGKLVSHPKVTNKSKTNWWKIAEEIDEQLCLYRDQSPDSIYLLGNKTSAGRIAKTDGNNEGFFILDEIDESKSIDAFEVSYQEALKVVREAYGEENVSIKLALVTGF